MSRYIRREFLADVGRGMLVAGVGSAVAHDLGLAPAALAAGTVERLTFGSMEPLVALMQETPADRLLPAVVELINAEDAQVAPQETLRPKLCWASRAISIRCWRVSSRNLRLRPSAAAARSAAGESGAISGSGSTPVTVISSRSILTSGMPVNQSLGSRPANQPRSFSAGEAPASSLSVLM